MKILITENQLNYIKEVNINANDPKHFEGRSFMRFMNIDKYYMVLMNKNDYESTLIVGKYKIPENVKSKVNDLITKLERKDIVMGRGNPDRSYIIPLHNFFPLQKENMIFDDSNTQENFNNQIKNKLNTEKLYLKEPRYKDNLKSPDDPQQSFTVGNYLICVVRNNQFRTIYLARGNDKHEIISNLKYKYKQLVWVDDINKYQTQTQGKL